MLLLTREQILFQTCYKSFFFKAHTKHINTGTVLYLSTIRCLGCLVIFIHKLLLGFSFHFALDASWIYLKTQCTGNGSSTPNWGKLETLLTSYWEMERNQRINREHKTLEILIWAEERPSMTMTGTHFNWLCCRENKSPKAAFLIM